MLEHIPNYIYCSITGQRNAARKDVMLDRIKQAGSLERLQKSYVCREARKLLKEGKSLEEVRKIVGYDKEHANNNLTLETAKGSSSMAKVRIHGSDNVDAFWRKPGYIVSMNAYAMDIPWVTRDACHRPDIYLSSTCDQCPLFAECTYSDKKLYKTKVR